MCNDLSCSECGSLLKIDPQSRRTTPCEKCINDAYLRGIKARHEKTLKELLSDEEIKLLLN